MASISYLGIVWASALRFCTLGMLKVFRGRLDLCFLTGLRSFLFWRHCAAMVRMGSFVSYFLGVTSSTQCCASLPIFGISSLPNVMFDPSSFLFLFLAPFFLRFPFLPFSAPFPFFFSSFIHSLPFLYLFFFSLLPSPSTHPPGISTSSELM